MKKTLLAVACCIASATAFAANINNGKALADKYACATCHGKDYNSPIDPSYPKLAGQHKDYLAHALVAYKRGDGPNGRNNPIMGGLVKPLSNKDIEDLAAYLHSLPGSMVVKR
ncbi:c-type cytochrome [Pseudoduganella umbonata]|uniref:Cytochrome c n=1 Tax=Pseudoduganella umbonata TaxID=864828 RepID=A0A4P8HRP7_9BURK|nr:cytochrome c [Pseudoduganella umbonata]MBB3220669.1 cytochrome c553 [Pseudoduganella umbonata]QCP11846.1 cytochrome c [Pseudoduganella umbonata]